MLSLLQVHKEQSFSIRRLVLGVHREMLRPKDGGAGRSGRVQLLPLDLLSPNFFQDASLEL